MKKRKGATTSSLFEEIAHEMNIDSAFVQKIAKEGKTRIHQMVEK